MLDGKEFYLCHGNPVCFLASSFKFVYSGIISDFYWKFLFFLTDLQAISYNIILKYMRRIKFVLLLFFTQFNFIDEQCDVNISILLNLTTFITIICGKQL